MRLSVTAAPCRAWLLSLSALVVLPLAGHAQGTVDRSGDQAAAMVRAMATQLLEVAPHAGLSVAIGRDGQIVFAEGFGFADRETRRPVTADTRFRAASVSKLMAVTALGRLVQEGRIDLDAPVQRYVPGFPEKRWPITARQLAGHLSGLPHYTPMDRLERRFYPNVTDALGVFSHLNQLAEPGTAYRYSTHGYTLLSAAIEGAAQQPFLSYLDEAVLRPLGMRHTGPDLRAQPHADMSTFYVVRDGRLEALGETEDPSYKWAGGGMTSTPSDLLRLAFGYLDGYLTPELVEMMWRSQRLSNGTETGVGIGWRPGRDLAGRRVVEHAGAMQGARSVLSIFPEQELVVSMMANREWSSHVEETAHMLALPYLDAGPRGPGLSADVEVTVDLMPANAPAKQVTGRLQLRDGRGTLDADGVRYPLMHVAGSNVFALFRATGIYYATVDVADGRIRGQAMSYSSPQLSAPTPEAPFLRFSGSLR